MPSSLAWVDESQTCGSAHHQLLAPIWEKSLERTARECQYLEVYWTSLLPHGQAFPPQAARYSTTSWTSAIQDLYYKDPLVRVVLLANALTLTAQHTNHLSLMMHGGRLYNLSLRLIARSLLDKRRQNTGGTLAASGLLASYEVGSVAFCFCTLPDLTWAHSHSSMTMDGIRGSPRLRGYGMSRANLLSSLLAAQKPSLRDTRTSYS